MEHMIRSALQNYKEYAAEAKLEAQWRAVYPNEPTRGKQQILEMRLVVLNCWLGLLSEMERFIIRRHLIDGLDLAKVRDEFIGKWGGGYGRSKHCLKKIEASGLRRIETFSISRMDVITRLWGEVPY